MFFTDQPGPYGTTVKSGVDSGSVSTGLCVQPDGSLGNCVQGKGDQAPSNASGIALADSIVTGLTQGLGIGTGGGSGKGDTSATGVDLVSGKAADQGAGGGNSSSAASCGAICQFFQSLLDALKKLLPDAKTIAIVILVLVLIMVMVAVVKK